MLNMVIAPFVTTRHLNALSIPVHIHANAYGLFAILNMSNTNNMVIFYSYVF
jgi:hypothetical protein